VPSIANEQGIADWKTLYDDAANADLKAARPKPTILYPGDQIEVPSRESKKVSGSTERRHRFRLKGEPLWLRVILKDINDEPVANTKYTLEIGNRVELDRLIDAIKDAPEVINAYRVHPGGGSEPAE